MALYLREAEAARFEMIDRELMQLALPWAEMLVRFDRLQIQSLEELPDPGHIRDLAAGIMTLLPHTRLSRLGINLWGITAWQVSRCGTRLVIGSRRKTCGLTP